MNENLIKKAIQSPEAVRLMYRALDKDPGPLTMRGPCDVPDGDMYCATVPYQSQDGKGYGAAVFDNIATYMQATGFVLAQYQMNPSIDVSSNMLSFILYGNGQVLASSLDLAPIYARMRGDNGSPTENVGLTLIVCLSADIPDDASADVVEMVQLLRGEVVKPVTELGLALKALDDC